MKRFLMLDIGAGTTDVLYYELESGQHYKAVAKSPIRLLAEKVQSLQGDLLFIGTEMGGGALSGILRQRAKTDEVIMSASSAPTIHHNPERLRSAGIKIVEDTRAEELREDKKYNVLRLGDIEPVRLQNIMEGFGLSFSFDVIGICAQDHGTPPEGVSHLDYRHSIFKSYLDKHPFPHTLLYRNDEVPDTLSRLKAIAESSKNLPTNEIYVMDSGMAAILGASMDRGARKKERVVILDVATSHTLGAALERGEIAGFFEYHTSDITLSRIEALLVDLAEGKLEHERILKEGGHGAYTRKAFGFKATEIIVATGPKRRLLQGSRLPVAYGSPLGDNMMTGTVGLLEAIRRRKGLEAISYL